MLGTIGFALCWLGHPHHHHHLFALRCCMNHISTVPLCPSLRDDRTVRSRRMLHAIPKLGSITVFMAFFFWQAGAQDCNTSLV